MEKAQLDDPSLDVAAAEIRVKQLQAQLAQVRAQDPSAEVAAAQVGLERTKIALDDAQDEYNKALDRPWEDQGIRDAWAKQLEQRQLDYRLAQAQLDGAQKAQRAHALSLAVLQAQIEEAQAQLERARIAEKAYPVTLDTLAADVDGARATLEALRTWENPYRDPAREGEIAQAEVGVRKAEIAVEQIVLQLEDAELRAPFDGTAADVDVKVGDEVKPGQVVVVLATLDELQVQHHRPDRAGRGADCGRKRRRGQRGRAARRQIRRRGERDRPAGAGLSRGRGVRGDGRVYRGRTARELALGDDGDGRD